MNAKAILILLALATPAAAQTCYVRPHAYAAPVSSSYGSGFHQQYIQEFFPIVLYQSGYDLQLQAVADLAARRATQVQVSAGVQQGYTAAGPPAAQGQPALAASGRVLATKCATCHSAASPAGGHVFDGSQAISPEEGFLIVRAFGKGLLSPKAEERMRPIVKDFQAANGQGALLDEVESLVYQYMQQPAAAPVPGVR